MEHHYFLMGKSTFSMAICNSYDQWDSMCQTISINMLINMINKHVYEPV
jgi:hypothetical protein